MKALAACLACFLPRFWFETCSSHLVRPFPFTFPSFRLAETGPFARIRPFDRKSIYRHTNMKIRSLIATAVSFCFLGIQQSMAVISLSYHGLYTQDFDTLAISGTSSTLPTGWAFVESGTNANTTYSANNGSSNTGNTYSFGAIDSEDRALGGLLSSSLIPTFGAAFTNNTGLTTIHLEISYFGEQWRLGATGRQDRLVFQYSTNATSLTTGDWISVPALDFGGPITTGTLGPLDGNASANRANVSSTIFDINVAEAATIWIRWNDFNAAGADDGLAVDDFQIKAIPEPTSALLGGLGLLALLRRRR